MKSIYAGSPKNPPAFCHSSLHPGYVTVKEMKRHNCLGKQCPLLEKYEHEYWHMRDRAKKKKMENRAAFAARVGR